MATFFSRYTEYLKHPQALGFGKKRFKRTHEHIRRRFDRLYPDHPKEYVHQSEPAGVFEVRNYPDWYTAIIDAVLWAQQAAISENVAKTASKKIAQPVATKQPKRERKRIPAKPRPAFSSKNNKS